MFSLFVFFFFFFKQKTAYEMRISDWSSDVCSSDLNQMWRTDPDLCCQVNKVNPLEEAKQDYDLWISSLMRWQTEHRAGLEIFEERRGMIKFNPMIDEIGRASCRERVCQYV